MQPLQRVVIFYVSIGSGHLSAAQAIAAALRQRNPDIEVVVEDALGWENRPRGLTDLLSAISTIVVPFLYDWAWRTGKMAWFFGLSSRMPMTRRHIFSRLQEFAPDIIVCTHALPCAILASARQVAPLVAVATDFGVHPYWPVRGVSAFIAPTQEARVVLIERGFPPKSVQPSGIPVRPEFSRNVRPGWTSTDPLHLLVMAGGGSIGPYLPVIPKVRAIIKRLAVKPVPRVCWTIVFGKNERLHSFAATLLDGRQDVKLIGYSDEMPRHMTEADLIVTKPGGLALAEALALGRPVLLLQEGAGQERANSQVVTTAGAGVLLESDAALFDFVRILQSNPLRLAQLRACAADLGKPQAASTAASRINSIWEESNRDGNEA